MVFCYQTSQHEKWEVVLRSSFEAKVLCPSFHASVYHPLVAESQNAEKTRLSAGSWHLPLS